MDSVRILYSYILACTLTRAFALNACALLYCRLHRRLAASSITARKTASIAAHITVSIAAHITDDTFFFRQQICTFRHFFPLFRHTPLYFRHTPLFFRH